MLSFTSIAVELTVGLFALILLTKIMGRASMSEATPFDFISMIVVGDFVSDAIYDPKAKVIKVLFAIAFWGLLIFLVGFITLKFNRSRAFFGSKPSLIIKNGIIDRDEMKRTKIDMNHLQMLLRSKQVFSVREVEFAVLEPNGKISVIKKPKFETVNRSDLKLPYNSVSLPFTLISDGKIVKESLESIGKTKDWLSRELSTRGIHKFQEVMLAEWREEDGLFVQTIKA
ncbi:DUF421 domain-containing protein [Terrilactibacillus sp. S3-3]|nr:DUF421 domain-containing protein [Terrilactibacillus sp. S3-3]